MRVLLALRLRTRRQIECRFYCAAIDVGCGGYREFRTAVNQRVKEVMAPADLPGVVADVVLKAASAAQPKPRYTAGGLASRLRLLRRFATAGMVHAGIRKDLRLNVTHAVKTL